MDLDRSFTCLQPKSIICGDSFHMFSTQDTITFLLKEWLYNLAFCSQAPPSTHPRTCKVYALKALQFHFPKSKGPKRHVKLSFALKDDIPISLYTAWWLNPHCIFIRDNCKYNACDHLTTMNVSFDTHIS